MSFSLDYALNNLIAGQKRTGKSKQFVFFNEDVVVKGPYNKKRYDNVITRGAIFKKWHTPMVVLPLRTLDLKDGLFVEFPNVMAGYDLEFEEHSESFSNYKYKILKNAQVTSVRKALDKNSNQWIYDQGVGLLTALCHCFILQVGDMHLNNCLVDVEKRQIYIIDYDDTLGKDRDDEFFYFNKKPAASLNWYENMVGYYAEVAKSLKRLLTDIKDSNLKNKKIYEQRTIDCINLLVKYSDPKNRTSKPSPVKKSNTKPSPTKTTVEKQDKDESLGDMGKMVWKGIRGNASKTYSGIDFDVAKSALQKYIRRNMTAKAVLVAIELYKFKNIQGASAATTNLFNRIAIIANEDIGPANLDLVLLVTSFLNPNSFKKDLPDVYTLCALVDLLSNSEKTRMMSHCWKTYANPLGREVANNMGISIDDTFKPDDLKFLESSKAHDLEKTIFEPSDPDNLRPYILTFYKRLLEKDFNAYSWVFFYTKLIEENDKLVLKRRKKFVNPKLKGTTGKPDILIWKVLSMFLPTRTHDILVAGYYDHSEQRPFLQHAILIALYRLKSTPSQEYIDFVEQKPDEWEFDNKTKDIEYNGKLFTKPEFVNLALSGNYNLVIDDFAKDMHTRAGKKRGMTKQQFVTEGSLVIPQSQKFFDPRFLKVYQTV